MKNKYHLRFMLVFLSFFYISCGTIFAQVTVPKAQVLPYTQDFSTLAASSTTYPEGFQGWSASITPGSSFNTTALLLADKPLMANSNASITSGNFHNYNGKIGFLNTGSLDLTLGFVIKTTDKFGISIEYDAMTIRNPYNGGTNTRINELVLQYRVGTTNVFTTLLPSLYLSSTTSQSTGTTAVDPQKIKIVLPKDCDNQDLVQIRWISRQVSGSGARPSFAIDNISVTTDLVPPVNTIGYPKTINILSDGFDFSIKLNEIGKTYFVVLPSGSAIPTPTQIKNGTDALDNTALKSGILTIADASAEYTQNIRGLSLGTAYVIYSIAEDNIGNIQATINKIDVLTSSVLVAALSTSKTELDFSFVEQNYNSSLLTYQIQANNLSGPVRLKATDNFTISKNENTGFQSTLVFTVDDFINTTTPTVFVKFLPNARGIFLGEIIHQSAGASNKTVVLRGAGINPYFQDFNDDNVFNTTGWTQYSVVGNTVKWARTTTRFNSSPGAVQINGYSETGASKDWLISPNLRLTTFDKFPVLSFYSRKFFSGTPLKLMVSVDYDGKSNPETATWTPLEGDFPTSTGTFKQSQHINLAPYKTDHTYLAWVYETVNSGISDTAEWTIDDVEISNETAFINANPTLNFAEVTLNTASPSQSFQLAAGGYGAITLAAPIDYQLSLDNTIFLSSITISDADAQIGKTIYARFVPSTKALTISGALVVTGTGLNKQIGFLKGSSFSKTETFDIATYNLEFFGSDVIGSNGKEFGPVDNALQITNVAKVMNTLNADVYAVQEVSDAAALDLLIQKISINGKTFDKSVSPAWSYSFNPPQADFPAQKLVVLYNTQTTIVKKARVMFSKMYDDIRSGATALANYPGGNSASFFASGRLPYLVDIEINIDGIKKDIKIINLHARANSGTDISKYNMRKYDVELLKDSLDVHYPDANLILLGDYNDDVNGSVISGKPSSFEKIVEDTSRYTTLTLEMSKLGAFTYLSSGGFLDHISISNELTPDYIVNSTMVYDPRLDLSNYVNTTSDHAPVIARFKLIADVPLSVDDVSSKERLSVMVYPNPVSESFNLVINSEITQDLNLNIYDFLGRAVGVPIKLKSFNGERTTKVNSSKLPVGIYFYTLSSGNKIIFSDKIIKE